MNEHNGCTEFNHLGPVVLVNGSGEPIDHGIGFAVRCEACDAVGGASIDLDEVDWL